MKKKIAILFCSALSVTLLGACSSKLDVEKNTIALQKSGKVLEAAVEDFSQSYYDEEELDTYIQEAVDSYVAENGKKTVSISESRVEEQIAYLTLKYDSCDTFSDFTGIECFSGSAVQAQAAGYDFDTEFYAAGDDGEAAGAQTVSKEDVLQDDDLKVFIVKDNSDIIVPGEIAYVSAEGTSIASKNTVTVQPKEEDTDEAILVYVLYR